jgi:hypothetical protein
LGLIVFAVLGLLACEGTKEPVFAPLKVSVTEPPGPATHDAGTVPMIDAGNHPVKPVHVEPVEEDAGDPPDPDLDPTVTFVWTETLPGQGTCHGGVYAGSFDCTVPDTDPLNPLPFSLSGQIAFTLDGSAEEQHLSITDGTGSISGPFLTSDVRGELDCIANHFSGASVDGAAVSIGDMNNPFAVVFPTFNASLQGTYDNQALVISGMFTLVNDRGATCIGTFRVSAAP